MRWATLFSLTLWVISPGMSCADDPRAEFFEKRIRPLLIAHCYECHGPDEASGKLRVDSKLGWQRGGESGPALVPGDPAASLLYRAAAHTDKRLKMPPGDSKQLSAKQLADLAHWIRQGAYDPRSRNVAPSPIEAAALQHWAFQPPGDPVAIPEGVHPIDFLVDRVLKAKRFAATPRATPRELVRRATLDLLGLPPTSKQRALYVESERTTFDIKFDELIDRLLESPRYGERWGRHWLDVARYSDAKDGVLMYGDARIRPFAYTYRDYVIQAFNEDKPFDQFIREQLAADQLGLPEDSPALGAMGFLTLGRMFDNNRHDVIDDQIDVVTRGFLGLTVTCARCHDHKFDPLPTADYYSLYGIFASSIEPLDRPRIEPLSEASQQFEQEYSAKLLEIRSRQDRHYQETLQTARERTSDYLVAVATTEPDVAETSIFFLSLLPDQLRPQITYRWRQLIARRGFPDDPLFGPWADLMQHPELREKEWRERGVDSRIIRALVDAKPSSPADVARVYGATIHNIWGRETKLRAELKSLKTRRDAQLQMSLNLTDMIAGRDGTKRGPVNVGIHPATGKPIKGETGFINIDMHDQLIPAANNPFVDGVFVPKGATAVVSSTGIKVQDLKPSSGQTWDYLKSGGSSGATDNRIDGVDFTQAPHSMLALHANKGVTFDMQAMRDRHAFQNCRFEAVLGNAGAKAKSRLDVAVYLDGHRVFVRRDLQAQTSGVPIDIAIAANQRFLTIVVTEGEQGISHDQAILGDPRIVLDAQRKLSPQQRDRIENWKMESIRIEDELRRFEAEPNDPIKQLLTSATSPVWFPKSEIYYYLSRKDKDAYRGMVNQLDAIAVKHASAPARAMILRDSDALCDPVIFQRGDPTLRGTPVPRRFLKQLSGKVRPTFQSGSGRLELADAIADAKNPLTARVWVNRVWMHHFGQPLVASPSDFGLRTKRPVQSALLDYLAAELIRNQWRTKPLHKLIMTSQAYQRSSQLGDSPQLLEQLKRDPQNWWLWRGNRRRLDLEQIRDSLLFVSGQLDLTMFGRPRSIDDKDNRRRTVYAFVERQNIPNIVQTFDFANADTSNARRGSTTVAQQALFAMNSRLVSEAANRLAEQIAPKGGKKSTEQKIQALFRRSLGRPPTPSELELAERYVASAGWPRLAQVLLMTNEFMFVD